MTEKEEAERERQARLILPAGWELRKTAARNWRITCGNWVLSFGPDPLETTQWALSNNYLGEVQP